MSFSTSSRCRCSCSCGSASSSERSDTMIFFFPVAGSICRRMVISAMTDSVRLGQCGECVCVDDFLFEEQVAQRFDEGPVLGDNAGSSAAGLLEQLADAAIERFELGGREMAVAARLAVVVLKATDTHRFAAHAELLDQGAGDRCRSMQVAARADREVVEQKLLRLTPAHENAEVVE